MMFREQVWLLSSRQAWGRLNDIYKKPIIIDAVIFFSVSSASLSGWKANATPEEAAEEAEEELRPSRPAKHAEAVPKNSSPESINLDGQLQQV